MSAESSASGRGSEGAESSDRALDMFAAGEDGEFTLHEVDTSCITYKAIMVGEVHTGKTSLFLHLSGRDISASPMNSGIDYTSVKRVVGGTDVRVLYFDTAGVETHKYSLSNQYYRKTDAVLLVYNVADEDSMHKLDDWNMDVRGQCTARPYISFLVGTKSDLTSDPRHSSTDVSMEMAQEVAEHLHCVDSYRISAKTGDGVEDMLLSIAGHLQRTNAGRPPKVPRLPSDQPNKPNAKCAC